LYGSAGGPEARNQGTKQIIAVAPEELAAGGDQGSTGEKNVVERTLACVYLPISGHYLGHLGEGDDSGDDAKERQEWVSAEGAWCP